jgi:predicted nucleic acid-binding protein
VRTYLDSNIFIHAFECETDLGHAARRAFKLADAGVAVGVTSQLTLAEVLPRPYEEGNLALEQAYETSLSKHNLEVYPVSSEILRLSARLRAQTKARLPDAIHVATAMQAACDALLSEDVSLRAPQHIRVLRLSDPLFA